MTVKYEIKNIKRTCMACPSQWEGHLVDGRMFYMRYRHSHFTFEVSPQPTDNVYDAVGGDLIIAISTDEEDGGWMGEQEARHLLKENGVILVDRKQ